MVDDGSFIYVEPAEVQRSEEDGPDADMDFLKADVEAAEKVADVDPVGVPSEPTVGGDFSDFEVRGVVDGREPRGEGSG